MRLNLIAVVTAAALSACATPATNLKNTTQISQPTIETVSFQADDKLTIHADLHSSLHPTYAPTIVLFHQARSNSRGEFAYLIPELKALGANVVTVDLRSGGDAFGETNRTAQAVGDTEYSYCETYQDVEAAVDFVDRRNLKGPLFLWGSSYSAALVVKYAGQNPEKTAGYLAFSPASGPPMEGCEPEQYLDTAGPGLIARPASELEYDWIASQYSTFAAAGAHAMTIEGGVHGASALNDARTNEDMTSYREEVFDFIHNAALKKETRVAFESGDWEIAGDVRTGLPAKRAGAVLMLNQAGGDRTDYAALAEKLAGRSLTTLRIDLRGHGESDNVARFDPADRDTRSIMDGSDADISAAKTFLAHNLGVSLEDTAIVGASYSAEEMVIAANNTGFARTYIGLSPGSLSDESIAMLDNSGASWLFIKAKEEHAFFDDLFAHIKSNSETALLKVIPGRGHAAKLLTTHPDLQNGVTHWIETTLDS